MRICKLGLIGLLLLIAAAPGSAQDIPADCASPLAPAYQPGVIPRYTPNGNRLELVSWTTGAVVRVLAEGIEPVVVTGWSATCRYLSAIRREGTTSTTLIFDAISGGLMGTVPDARGIPHRLYWGPDDYLLVDRRMGALLWHVPSGQQTALDTAYNTGLAATVTRVRWDAAHLEMILDLAVGGRVVYDLTTGQPLAAATEEIDGVAPADLDASIFIGGGRYVCRDIDVYVPGRSSFGSGLFANDLRTELVPYWDGRYNLLTYRLLTGSSPMSESVIAVLEADAAPADQWLDFLQWTPDCRQFIMRYGRWNASGQPVVVGWQARDRDTGRVISRVTRAEVAFAQLGPVLPDGRFPFRRWDTEQEFIWSIAEDTVTPATSADITALSPTPVQSTEWSYTSRYEFRTDGLASLPPLPGMAGPSRHERPCGIVLEYGGVYGRTLVAVYADGQRVSLASDLNATEPLPFTIDPTCRYAAATIVQGDDRPLGYDAGRIEDQARFSNRVMVLYDLLTQQPVAQFPDNQGGTPRLYWSPDSQYGLAVTGAGAFVWSAATGAVVVLADGEADCPELHDRPLVYFDPPTGQLWVSGFYGVNVFDLHTGGCRRALGGHPVNDFSGAVLFTGLEGRIRLIDRATLAGLAELDNDPPARSLGNFDRVLAISPDRRWFVYAGSYAAGAFSVWDLTALPAAVNARDPVVVRRVDSITPDEGDIIDAIVFLDAAAMQTTHRDGTVRRWDIATGTLLSLSP